ncbi:MAG: hypothetical protein JKY65_05785 [Planctomycetes bacterium]|nr:hypothetical protein [Planctomycetota bacterium]
MSDWLNGIDVASPCHESWGDMTGDARQRECDKCEQTVYDLSGMARSEAEALVRRTQSGESVCVRFRRRADGTVLTADCPTRVRKTRSQWTQVRSVAAGLFALAGGLAAGCTDSVVATTATMGAPRVVQGQSANGVAPGTTGTPGTTATTANAQTPCCDGTGPCCPQVEMGVVDMMGDMVAPDDMPLLPLSPKPADPDRKIMGKMKAPPVKVVPATKKERTPRRLPTAGKLK